MKNLLKTLSIASCLSLMACSTQPKAMDIKHPDDSLTIVEINRAQAYLLLPIEESAPEVALRLVGNRPEDTWMDIRLARDSVDYYVPLALPNRSSQIEILKLPKTSIAWSKMQLSDTFDAGTPDYYRPTYHYSPPYGWMNDPNGLVYHNGIYHLYYQYNPYGSKWGNMHWGHATTKDFIHWDNHSPALARDTMGHIFSGSAIIDHNNIAGFGKGSILAYYTAHQMKGQKQWQAQALAYSTDGGYTYTKYQANPILTPSDGVADFRDPKVFYYPPRKQWYMIVSADKEMRFYRTDDLKAWHYVSAFGEGYGARPNQFECPDFFELPMEGSGEKKWVMLVNINPGYPFGGSATEYFVGSFDGNTFIPDTEPEIARWLDFGKDHYAFVTFHATQGRVLGIPWVSNWQYANVTPYRQSRGINGLPRELFLFSAHGRSYVGARPAPEVLALRKEQLKLPLHRELQDSLSLDTDLSTLHNSLEIALSLTPSASTERVGLILSNDLGEELPIYLDLKQRRITMDRTKSGITDFGSEATPHERESADWRNHEAINYHNDFALATYAPLNLCTGKTYSLRLFLDRSTAELFVDGGRIAMTNLIFPRKPYSTLQLFSHGGKTSIQSLNVYRLAP